MGIITRMRKQTAVYWAAATNDGRGGFTFTTAVQINCRWQDVQEMFVDFEGREIMSTAKVFPDRVLLNDSYLWLGTLASLTAPYTDPRTVANARQMKKFSQIPNLRNTETLYIAFLR